MNTYPVIMCGGPGARLWPSSTASCPKPLIALLGPQSLFQKTVLRLAGLPGARPPVVVAGAAHADEVRRQLAAVGGGGTILSEPAGRDSGPALLAAVAWIARLDPDAVVVAVASDHHIPDDAAFAAAVAAARDAVDNGEIVTFGVAPAEPSSAYGYIRPGDLLAGDPSVRRVAVFVEKPDQTRARGLVDDGCLWNSGNFMFRADALLREARTFAPGVLDCVLSAIAEGADRDGVFHLGATFRDADRISIDVAVMEKTRRAAVLPIDYAWSDLGSWDAVWRASDQDAHGNAVSGLAHVSESAGCLIRAEAGTEVVALGLKNLAVVAWAGQVLVSDLGAVATLKPALDGLAARRQALASATGDPATELAAASNRLTQWLWRDALPLWWCFGADHAGGGFHESLNLDLSPTGADRRARVQARQVFVYATAGLTGWPGPWRAAMDHGLAWLVDKFARPDGLFRASVDMDGEPVDNSAVLYDQAFVLLAMATAARAAPDLADRLRQRARALLAAIRGAFGHTPGGFRGREGADVFQLDPIMHLFEAALAWRDVEDDPVWNALADEIGALFLTKLLDHHQGGVREDFDPNWRPAPGVVGRMLRPGHHFEWAWLLRRWAARRPRPDAETAAKALFKAGSRGVDTTTGLVVDVLLDDFSVHEATSRLWPQTEYLRAAVLFAREGTEVDPTHLAAALSAARAMEAYFTTPVRGLWRDTPAFTPPADPAPARASSLYHIIGAITALGEAYPW